MPVISYLAFPMKGAKQELLHELAAMDDCEPLAAENEDILILVTDTPDESREKKLQERLKQLKSLQSLSMAFGYVDDYRHSDN